jgi:hypothetical protein
VPQQPNREQPAIDFYRSANTGQRFQVQAQGDWTETLAEDERVFAYRRYADEIHPPLPLPAINTECLQPLPRCLDMPLRLSGQETYHLPDEWAPVRPLLEQIIALEQTHNRHWRDYHTYMTIDCSELALDDQQRHGGLHVDGFQGERIREKTKITRNYIVSTNGGTRFYQQRFVVADPARFNVFHGFDMQTQGWNNNSFIEAEEGVVHFIDAFSVHESGRANRSGQRIFFRLTFDLKPFDRLGNTENGMLKTSWTAVARRIHDQVSSPDINDLIASPSFPPRPVKHQTRYSVERPLLIGVSGKPGSGKNWIVFRLIQELRFCGLQAGQTSLAAAVYHQANLIIDDCVAGMGRAELLNTYQLADDVHSATLYQHWTGDVGVKHPQYGYHRRQQAVRQGLAELTAARRAEDPDYWLKIMLEQVRLRGLEAAVFADLRFPNEADYLRAHDGYCLRAELDQRWLQATMGRNPGYKYSEESLQSPMESALDHYDAFLARISAQTVDASALVASMIDKTGSLSIYD